MKKKLQTLLLTLAFVFAAAIAVTGVFGYGRAEAKAANGISSVKVLGYDVIRVKFSKAKNLKAKDVKISYKKTKNDTYNNLVVDEVNKVNSKVYDVFIKNHDSQGKLINNLFFGYFVRVKIGDSSKETIYYDENKPEITYVTGTVNESQMVYVYFTNHTKGRCKYTISKLPKGMKAKKYKNYVVLKGKPKNVLNGNKVLVTATDKYGKKVEGTVLFYIGSTSKPVVYSRNEREENTVISGDGKKEEFYIITYGGSGDKKDYKYKMTNKIPGVSLKRERSVYFEVSDKIATGKHTIKYTVTDKKGHKVSSSIKFTAKKAVKLDIALKTNDNKSIGGQTIEIEYRDKNNKYYKYDYYKDRAVYDTNTSGIYTAYVVPDTAFRMEISTNNKKLNVFFKHYSVAKKSKKIEVTLPLYKVSLETPDKSSLKDCIWWDGDAYKYDDTYREYIGEGAELYLRKGEYNITGKEDSSYKYNASFTVNKSMTITVGLIMPQNQDIKASAGISRDCRAESKAADTKVVDGVTYSSDGKALMDYPNTKEDSTFTVPDGVTEILQAAFWGNKYLTSVTIPDSVTEIKGGAFCGCSNLVKVELPKTVKINYGCFEGCSSLKEIVLPENLETLESRVFNGCSSIEKIALPDSLKTIEGACFNNCSSLKGIVLPESLVTIGWDAFFGCKSLSAITIPKNVSEIGTDAFYNAGIEQFEVSEENNTFIAVDGMVYTKDLTKLCCFTDGKKGEFSFVVPDTVTSMCRIAADGLKSLTLGSNVMKFNLGTIVGCDNLEELHFGKSIDNMNPYYFNMQNYMKGKVWHKLKRIDADPDCKKFVSYKNAIYSKDYTILYMLPWGASKLSLHKNLEKIYSKSYISGRENHFSSITIPDTGKNFKSKNGVLYNKKMTKIIFFPSEKTSYTIPKTVKNIDEILPKCYWIDYSEDDDNDSSHDRILALQSTIVVKNLNSIKVAAKNPYYSAKNGVLYNKKKTKLFLYPPQKKGSFTVPSSVSEVKISAFGYAEKLTKLVIPGKVLAIQLILSNCKKLTRITLKKGVVHAIIDMGTEKGSLNRVDFPDTLAFLAGNFTTKPNIYGYKNTPAKSYAAGKGYKFVSRGNAKFKVGEISRSYNYKKQTQTYQWDKVKNASGYEVYEIKSGKKKHLKTVTKPKATFALKKSMGYWVYARPYQMKNGKKVYGKSGCYFVGYYI